METCPRSFGNATGGQYERPPDHLGWRILSISCNLCAQNSAQIGITDMSEDEKLYGHLTGRRRWVIMLLGALSGLVIALLFAWFAGRSATALELLVGIVAGGLLGLSASLGEKRRRKT